MKLAPKKIVYITTGSIFIGGLLILFFVVSPVYQSFVSLSEEFQNAEDKLALLIMRQQQVGDLEHQILVNQDTVFKIDTVLYEPETDDLNFILLMERLASETHNEHTLAPPAFRKSDTAISYFTSTITIQGTFENLLRFLERFSSMQYYSDIDSLEIKRLRVSGDGTSILETSFTFKVFTK